MARILITGASGFLGSHLLARLRDEGHDVFGTTTAKPDGPIMYCNIEDADGVNALVQSVRPEIIVHCAAISSVTAATNREYYLVNTVGTENLVRASANFVENGRFVFISTAGVYGNQKEEFLHEGLCPDPVHHYGMSKLCCEKLIRNYSDKVRYSVIRPFNIVGHGQNRDFIVPKLVDAFHRRDKAVRLGNIDVYRDYIDVQDAVDIIRHIMFEPKSEGEVYNLCSGRPVSLKELIQALTDITGHHIDVEVAQEFVRKNEVWRLLGDTTKLESMMGGPLSCRPIEQSLRNMLAAKAADRE